MKKFSLFFIIIVVSLLNHLTVFGVVADPHTINITITPGALRTSGATPQQDFTFSVSVSPQPPTGTVANLEVGIDGTTTYQDKGVVPFRLPGTQVSSNRFTFPCGLVQKARVKLQVPGIEPEYSGDFRFITQGCSGGQGGQLGPNQFIIPITTGGNYFVSVDLSPSNISSTSAAISGQVQDRSAPAKPISRVGLEIKEHTQSTFRDDGGVNSVPDGLNINFRKLYQQLRPDTAYDVRVWVTSGTDKKYTESFSLQTKRNDGTGGSTSTLASVTIRLSGASTEENTTILYTAQMPGTFSRYLSAQVTFGLEVEESPAGTTPSTWRNVHTESTTVGRSANIVQDKNISSNRENGWDFSCATAYKMRGFFSIRENPADPQPTKILSPEITFSTADCPPATTGGTPPPPEEGDNVYTFLTPLPLGDNLDTVSSVVIGAAGDGGILGVLQRIFTIMLVAAIVLAVVYMIIGGARYATGDSLGSKMGGKEVITNAIKGLLFALLAWLLLNIINPDLLRFTISIPNIGKGSTQGTGATPTGSITGGGCPVADTDEECFAKIKADEERVRGILREAGITIERGDTACARFGQTACTTVGLLNEATLANIIKVKTDCDCAIIITGGTEYWLHGSGGNHKRFIALDLKIGGTALDTFIRSKQSQGRSRVCNARFQYSGLLFCDEQIAGNPPHWHVDTVGGGGGTSGEPVLFTFPRINIRGHIIPGRGSVYGPGEISNKITNPAMTALRPRVAAAVSGQGIDFKLFYALIAQESGGNPQAGSGAGACGVAQLLPGTARPLDPSLAGLSDSAVCTALKDSVDLSLRVGVKYLKKGFQEGGDSKNALAYYNGGPDAIVDSNNCPGRKAYECPWDASGYYNRTNPTGEPLKALEDRSHINTGFSETRFYVINILNMAAVVQ